MHYYRSIHTSNRYRFEPRNKVVSHRSKFRLPQIILLCLILSGVYFLHPFDLRGPSVGSSKVAAAEAPVLDQSQANVMAAQINNVISAHPGMEISVAVKDLNGDRGYHYGLSDPFIAASISKILTACLFLHTVESGQNNLNEPVNGAPAQYELQQLIEQSDNDAWSAFNSLLTHDGLRSYAASIGLSNYDPDQNTLTVDDISLLLAKIYNKKLLDSQHTNLLLSYLHSANEDDFIVASVPAKAKIYHKAGWLEDRVHDAAIIDDGKHPYVLVIFTKDDSGAYDSDAGHRIFSDITGATTQAFLR